MVADETDRSSDGDDAPRPPIRRAFDQLGNEWRLLVLYELQAGEQRFNDLERSVGVNPRTLSRTLEALRELGLVTRRIERDAPVATYYSLTEKGESLERVFATIERQLLENEEE